MDEGDRERLLALAAITCPLCSKSFQNGRGYQRHTASFFLSRSIDKLGKANQEIATFDTAVKEPRKAL